MSTRTLAALGLLAVSVGTVLGAGVALRSSAVPTPITPVGLLGEPSAVAQPDGGAPPPPSAPLRGTLSVRARSVPDAAMAVSNPDASTPVSADTVGETLPSRDAGPTGAPRAVAGPALVSPMDTRGTDRTAVPSGGPSHGADGEATGRMDPRVFSMVYQHYIPQVTACYGTASRSHDVAGVILMRVRIGTDGHVAHTRALSDTTGSSTLATCVQNAMRTWRFPPPQGGAVDVDYPLRFGASH